MRRSRFVSRNVWLKNEIGEENILVDATLEVSWRVWCRRIIRRALKKCLGRKFYSRLWFRYRHGYWPNLRAPRGYNEKLLWLSLFADLESLGPFTDKYAVRQYVARKLGPEYLVPVHAVYRAETDLLPLGALPPRFVLKATHGSHMTLIVRNRNSLSERAYEGVCRRWLRIQYSDVFDEPVYKKCQRGIIVEELLNPKQGALFDFKFLCYQGNPKFINVHGGRFKDHREAYYTTDWQPLPIREFLPGFKTPLEPPPELALLCEAACRLSADFTFVRVDLYAFENRVFFGELTFLPANGRSPLRPREYEYVLGADIPVRPNIWLGEST